MSPDSRRPERRSLVHGHDDGRDYRVRRMESAPFVAAGCLVLATGAMVAIRQSGTALLFGLICLVNVLMWFYVAGPAASVTVRRDTLEISNPLVRHLIPRWRVVSIEPVNRVGIWVRLEGNKLIWVQALSRGLFRWTNPSQAELLVRANRLGEALSATPAPRDLREVETTYRWANLLGICIGAIGLGVLLYVSQHLK